MFHVHFFASEREGYLEKEGEGGGGGGVSFRKGGFQPWRKLCLMTFEIVYKVQCMCCDLFIYIFNFSIVCSLFV